ncbi:trypsin-3-like [Uranotaenia lowii]|uniref:trypsin-3-like n=1 Tax=Uranotaenia lowii TaxID=190385 RepID=UPI002479054A|nr:trypsin-3-like [Uranotaenia lowii]
MVKSLVILILFVFGVVASKEDVPSSRVAGGAETFPGQFPYVVSIDSPYNLHCGGTILNRQHVLTTGYCVMHPVSFTLVNPFWLRVIAGDVNLVSPSIRREVRNVTHIFVHPNYNLLTGNNDLAVMRLHTPLPEFHNTIEPASINRRLLSDNTMCQYAGWGALSNTAPNVLFPRQHFINVPILPTEQCNAPNVHGNRVLPTMFCAGSITTNPNTVCHGNIGGGLFCNDQLTGVLVFGLACGTANQPGVYMDVRQYREWIDLQFDRTDNPPPGWSPPMPTN